MWDFLPTVAELIGVALPDEMDGISILPTLMGESEDAFKQRMAQLGITAQERPLNVADF